jgi:hypothetical protein
MPDFEELRQRLARYRRERDVKARQALLASETVKGAKRAVTNSGLYSDNERASHKAVLEKAKTRAEEATSVLATAKENLTELSKEFERFTDPRQELVRWSDQYPILLLPLRLETRFKNSKSGQPQLWVRIFPDTCLIDTFEASLTEQEVTNAQRFWARIWRAAGDEALEREAWRDLVGSHGSGRASWIVRSYMPLNPNDKPVKATSTDVLLIIVAPAELDPAVVAYWQKIWKAGNDSDALHTANDNLNAALGQEAANKIRQGAKPFNFADFPVPPATRQTTQVKVAVLRLTPLSALQTRSTSWSSAPHVELLPERFVFIGYDQTNTPLVELGATVQTPLIVGPNPNASPDQQLKPTGNDPNLPNDDLQIPDELAWMFDFERALQVGMALRFDLTPEQASQGFRRVIVLGVRLADSPEEGKGHLEQLLEHHLCSRTGLEILPQGTPTNNTEKNSSGYSFRDDSEATFQTFFRASPQYTTQSDPLLRRDGQWFSDLLGLRPDLVQRIPHAGGTDQSEARAMQIALWPGTWGYMLTTLLAPIFSQESITATRRFFTRYVSGRGPLPAIRIGDQPYGILPTTTFGKVNWFSSDKSNGYFAQLYAILKRMNDAWTRLVYHVSYVGKSGDDPHQVLLDVLGLHPGSVEYYPLQADSFDAKYYEFSFWDFAGAFTEGLKDVSELPLALLRDFGYTGQTVPDLLTKIFHARLTPLNGPLIDDRSLSESEPIRNYAGNRNYIEWLLDAAQTGIERVQEEQGFDGGTKPVALLYLLLRHAVQLSFHATGVRLNFAANPAFDRVGAWHEPEFVHLAEKGESESRYAVLYGTDARITGRSDLKLGDYIARNLRAIDSDLREQIEALERLARVPTARLERVFAEHLDCCSYRLDAWKMGLYSMQLEKMRREGGQQASTGLYLGAYGWVEPLKPENKTLTPVKLPGDLDDVMNRGTTIPLMQDSTNEGLIHAPSLNHATTAAVLRNGYLGNDGRLAVNLTSRRVRLALGILEGMRNGQSLGALLGYQFERYIHDNGPLEVRSLVYPLRRAFPLVAEQIAKTKAQAPETQEESDAREAIVAMNVVDGRKLVEYVEKKRVFSYPFGVASLPQATADQGNATTKALDYIRDINDAVADLVLAEGVHQAVNGNYERSAGTLDAFAKGNYPPEPDVIRTPRTGVVVTHRVAVHFSSSPAQNPLAPLPLTPLATLEPALNGWVAERLPTPQSVGCHVKFTDSVSGNEQTVFISQEDVALQPIDLLYRVDASTSQALTDLDDRILYYLHTNHAPHYNKEIKILYTERVPNKVTWFELQALLRSLRTLVTPSRSVQPADLMRASDASSTNQAAVSLAKARLETPRDDLQNVLSPRLDTIITHANAATSIDDLLAEFAETVGKFAAYRLPQTGTGFVYEWRATTYGTVTEKIRERVQRWNDRLTRYQNKIDAYDVLTAATTEAERIKLLQASEILIRVQLTTRVPATAAAYRNALNARKAAFVNRRDALQDLIDTARPTLAELLADAKALLPLDEFDPDPFDFADQDKEIHRFREELKAAVIRLKDDVAKRVTGVGGVDALLAEHDTAAPTARVDLLQKGARLLFGDDVKLVPQITLPVTAAEEVANAWQYTKNGNLTKHLTTTAGREFPVDDWLHGIARVREKMHHWENVVLIGDALRPDHSLELTPLQLPSQSGESWIAMEFPDEMPNGDRLLYTAHFVEAFDKTKAIDKTKGICGLLLDEWTEVIPGDEETTGVAFHFDRPNAESPQAWLLALPAVRNGSWSWEELVETVNDTLDYAKLRAVEPVHVDMTAYSWFLPATMSAYSFPEISISNNLLRNAQIYKQLAAIS